jgi:hypothetical protein
MFEPQSALVSARGPEQGQSSSRTPFGFPRLTAKKWPNQAKNSTSPNPTNVERFSQTYACKVPGFGERR